MTILVVGDVVDDISVLPLEPVTPRTDTRAQIRMSPGGSAANTAAWLGFLGADVRFVGKAGADGAVRHSMALADFGVDASIAADPVTPTATIGAHRRESRTASMHSGAHDTSASPHHPYGGNDATHSATCAAASAQASAVARVRVLTCPRSR